MPQDYSERPGKGKKKQREFVGKYLASKSVAKSRVGDRSNRELKLRAEGRAMFQAQKKKKTGRSKTARTSGVTADRSAQQAVRTSGRTADSRGRGNVRPRGGM